MAKKSLPKPTEAELAILRVLWERGPSTVRDVQEAALEAAARHGIYDRAEALANHDRQGARPPRRSPADSRL